MSNEQILKELKRINEGINIIMMAILFIVVILLFILPITT